MNYSARTQLKFDSTFKNAALPECDDTWATELLALCVNKHSEQLKSKRRKSTGYCAQKGAKERVKRIGQALPAHYVQSECDAVYALAKKLEKEDGLKRSVDHIIPLMGRDEDGVHIVCGLHVACNLQIVLASENALKGCYVGGRKKGERVYSEHKKNGNAARMSLRQGYVMPPWADFEAIRAIYAEARRLTRETGIPREVDHIVSLVEKNDSGEHIACGLHVAENLRIVTRAENRSKGCYSGRI